MTTIKDYATKLAGLLSQIEDIKIEAKALVEIAAEQGIDAKALRKVAKEMVTDSAKLQRKYDDENQLQLFRNEVDLYQVKGLMEYSEAAE